MKCHTCPVGAGTCLGESVPRLCFLASTRVDYRRHLTRLAGESPSEGQEIDLSAALATISACPHRGPVLAVGLQPECGCSELSECRAGKGEVAGRVTVHDCLACVVRRPDESNLNLEPPP